jgi:glycosyltransferase involved in cell wall biosynthesis
VKLSIVVPAHNEEDRIRPMLDAYTVYFADRYGQDFEIIVVVNASTDATPSVVESYRRDHPQVNLIVEPRQVGKGGAVTLGFQAARGELVGFVDADGSTPPAAYQDLVDHIEDAGIIIASRWRPDSDVSPRQPLARRIASRIFNGMVRVLFKLPLTDTQCGAKLMSRTALREVMPRMGLTRWAFDVDLLFQMRLAGYRIIERPTTWHDVAGSKLNVPRASSEMFIALCRLRMIHSPLRWVVTLYDRSLGRVVHKNW